MASHGRCPWRTRLGPALLLLVFHRAAASPNHDDVQAATEHTVSYQDYSSGRRLSTDSQHEACEVIHTRPMAPIRIAYDVIHVDPDVLPETRTFIETVILRRAVNYWERTLKVHRLTGPLRVDRQGMDCQTFGLGFRDMVFAQAPRSCTYANAPTCGPNRYIPERYLKSMKICKKNCPPPLETIDHLVTWTGGPPCDNCTVLPDGPGALNADFLAIVTIEQSSFCESRTKAHGSSCVRDQCDRPIVGWINFCAAFVTHDPKDTNAHVSTAIHELGHALAFSAHLFAYFRHPDGSPRFPRNPEHPNELLGEVKWSCSRSSYLWNDPNGDRRFVDLSQAGIIEKDSERGIDNCPCPVGTPFMQQGCIQSSTGLREPKCVFKFILNKVREEAQRYFDCPYLTGAELENQPTSMCEIVGSHWETRIFMGELMTPGLFQDYVFLSRVTLALFEDSGWYLPDYEMADTVVKGVHWGYQQGCAFALEKCVVNGVTKFPRFWCTKSGTKKCSLFRREELMCALTPPPVPPPPAWQYFPDNQVGDLCEADFCPFFDQQTTHVCTDPGSTFAPHPGANYMREIFGPDSRCLESTLRKSAGPDWPARAFMFRQQMPVCMRVLCNPDGVSYDVFRATLKGGVLKLGTCMAEGQNLTAPGFQGSLTCANFNELCSDGLQGARHVSQLFEENDSKDKGLLQVASQSWPGLLAVAGIAGLSVMALALRCGSQARTENHMRDFMLVEAEQDNHAAQQDDSVVE